MRSRSRILLLAGAPLALAGSLGIAWVILPGVRQCASIFCGRNFDPGGLNVFGQQQFTPAQTAVMASGILITSFMVALAVLPRSAPWTPAGMAVLVLAVVIALALPSPTTGPAPTTPCSTPGPDGPVAGACVTGPSPVDTRIGDRVLLLAGGLVVLGLGVGADRSREGRRRAGVPVTA